MKTHFPNLFDLSKKNLALCDWCNQKSSLEYLKLLKDEISELEQAFQKSDFDNIEEELGDVFWDLLILSLICEKEGKVNANRIIPRILEKFSNRKPWLISGELVTREQAAKIWVAAKLKEKMDKENKFSTNK